MSANGISRLPTREERQKAKLELAAAKRSKNNNARSIYNIDDLPTQYVANSVVDNSTNLSIGRPWVSGNYVKNIITNIFSPSDLMCVVDLNDLTADKLSWRRNLLTYSENLSNSTWTFFNVSGTSSRTGNTLVFGSSPIDRVIQSSVVLENGGSYTVSIKMSGSGEVRIIPVDGNGSTGKGIKTVQLTSQPTIYTTSFTAVAGTGGVGIYNNAVGIAGAVCTVEYVQFEKGNAPTDYQPITNFNTEFLNRFPLHTLYQDAAGTIPATAVGQPVGLVLDKSRGLVLGSERVVNGDFSKGSANWNVSGADATHIVTFADGKVRYQSDTISPVLSLNQGGAVVTGKWYEVTINCSSYVSGSLKIDAGNGAQVVVSGLGTFKTKILASINVLVLVRNSPNVDLTIDSISVKELPGNHAYQPTSASRPVLGRHPVGGARNLLTYSGTVTDSSWNFLNGTKTGGQLDSDGGYTATKITGPTNGPSTKAITAPVSGAYTYTVCLKAGTQTTAELLLRNATTASNFTIGTINLTTGAITGVGWTSKAKPNGYWECSYTQTTGISANDTLVIYYGTLGSATASFDIIVDYAQLEVGSVATPYQETTTLLDITERGKTDAWYLKFDGVDDFLVTNSINFTMTDKISLFAGVRKLSDAAAGVVCGLSADIDKNAGAFYLAAPLAINQNNFSFASRGTVQVNATSTSLFPSPTSKVVTSIGDISSPKATIRVNGAVASTRASQGLGKYGNYPLYIGRQGGTALPFNGHLYSLVIVSRLSTNSETNAMENAISKQMGVSL